MQINSIEAYVSHDNAQELREMAYGRYRRQQAELFELETETPTPEQLALQEREYHAMLDAEETEAWRAEQRELDEDLEESYHPEWRCPPRE